MNKILALALTGLAFACLGFAVFSKIFFGYGAENPVYKLTGLYNIHLFIIGAALLLLAFIVNHYTRNIVTNALLNRKNSKSSLLYKDSVNNIRLFLSANIALFILVSLYYFNAISDQRLFLGVDGNYVISMAIQQKIWNASLLSFGANFLQGMGGNIWFPLNTPIDPGYILATLGSGLNYTIAHSVWALLLFASTLGLARTVKLNWVCAVFAAWLAGCLILFPSPFQFSKVPALIPHLSTTIALTTLMAAIIIQQSRDVKAAIIRSVSILLLTVYFVCHAPTFTLVAFPFLAACALAKLIITPTRQDRLREIAVFAAPFVFIVLSGMLLFVAGLFLDTATHIFPQDFLVPEKKLSSISALFMFGYPLTGVMCLMAFAGIIACLRVQDKSPELKTLAVASGTLCVFIFIFGFACFLKPQIWNGPSANYFEFMLWPVYAIFIAFFAMRLLMFVKLKKYAFTRHAIYLIPAIPTLFFLFLGISNPTEHDWDFPPPASPVMDRLMENAHKPEENFKGRVATFTGLNIAEPLSWLDIQMLDYKNLGALNNDFRKAGLWFNAIPTLTEYSPLITPQFHYVTRNILGRKGDQEVRNMMTLRKLSPLYLRAMGVSKLVTDTPLSGQKLLAQEKYEEGAVYLYAFTNPNLGNWSPTKAVIYKDAAEAINIMKSGGFNPGQEILLEKPLEDVKLTPATATQMIVGQGRYEISAQSRDHSVLLLPVEYSHCFDFSAQSNGAFTPVLLRGNIMFAAVLFQKDIKATLTYKNGPFTRPGCRLKDYREFKALLKGKTE